MAYNNNLDKATISCFEIIKDNKAFIKILSREGYLDGDGRIARSILPLLIELFNLIPDREINAVDRSFNIGDYHDIYRYIPRDKISAYSDGEDTSHYFMEVGGRFYKTFLYKDSHGYSSDDDISTFFEEIKLRRVEVYEYE